MDGTPQTQPGSLKAGDPSGSTEKKPSRPKSGRAANDSPAPQLQPGLATPATARKPVKSNRDPADNDASGAGDDSDVPRSTSKRAASAGKRGRKKQGTHENAPFSDLYGPDAGVRNPLLPPSAHSGQQAAEAAADEEAASEAAYQKEIEAEQQLAAEYTGWSSRPYALLFLAVVLPAAACVALFGWVEPAHAEKWDVEQRAPQSEAAIPLTALAASLLAEQFAATDVAYFHQTPTQAAQFLSFPYFPDTNTAEYSAARQRFKEAEAATDAVVAEAVLERTADTFAPFAARGGIDLGALAQLRTAALEGGDSVAATLDAYAATAHVALRLAAASTVPRQFATRPGAEQRAQRVARAAYAAELASLVALLEASVQRTASNETLELDTAMFGTSLVDALAGCDSAFYGHMGVSGEATLTDAVSPAAAAAAGAASPINDVWSTSVPPAARAVAQAIRTGAFVSAQAAASARNASDAAALRALHLALLSRLALQRTETRATVGASAGTTAKEQFGLLSSLFALGVAMLFINALFVAQDARSGDAREQRQREVRATQRGLDRLRVYVRRLAGLEPAALARRAGRGMLNHEVTLTQQCSGWRDVSLFLAPTVRNHPEAIASAAKATELADGEGTAFGPSILSKHGLFLSSSLHLSRTLCGLRASLNHFHVAFHSAGSKQKAIQHQLTRFLTFLEEHAEHRHGFLSIHGDFVDLWVEVLNGASGQPCLELARAAFDINTKCRAAMLPVPQLALTCADGYIGNVSTLAAPPSSTLSGLNPTVAYTSVVVFGRVADELEALSTLCRLHDVNTVCTQSFKERLALDMREAMNDVFASREHEESPALLVKSLRFKPLEVALFTEANKAFWAPPLASDMSRSGTGALFRGGQLVRRATVSTHAAVSAMCKMNEFETVFELVRSVSENTESAGAAAAQWDATFQTFLSSASGGTEAQQKALTALDKYAEMCGADGSVQRLRTVLRAAMAGALARGGPSSSPPENNEIPTIWGTTQSMLRRHDIINCV